MNKTLTALVSLSLLPLSALAYDVVAPHEGTVLGTTYTSSGTFHGALDIASGKPCGTVPMDSPIQASITWNITLRTSGKVCSGNGSGSQNEARHTFANGYTFRLWHFLKTADSVDRTCNRCVLGDEGGTGYVAGPQTHLQYDKSGTNNTSWYLGTTKGEYLDRGEKIGTAG